MIQKLSALQRYALALVIFLLALALRLALFPVEASFHFFTFVPATIICFYFLGIRAGVFITGLCAASIYYVFVAPYWIWSVKHEANVRVLGFMISCVLIGYIIKKLQDQQSLLNRSFIDLKQSEQQYLKLLEDQTELISRLKADGTYLYANAAFCRLFGVQRENLIGSIWQPIVWEDDVPQIKQKLATLSPQNPVVIIENRIITASGMRWGQFINRGFFNSYGKLEEIQSIGRDVTDRKLAEIALQNLTNEQSTMLDNDIVGMLKIKNRQILWVNKAFANLLGYEKSELEGKNTRIIYPDDKAYENLGAEAYPILGEGGTYRSQQLLVKKSGEPVWMDINGTPLACGKDESFWVMADISVIKQQQEAVEKIAFHDELTGLPNRRLLSDRLEQALGHARRNNKMLAVCYLDLDGFKPINDAYGHEAGDKLLIHVATGMHEAIRANDTVSRIGGDEFVILLTNLENIDEYKLVLSRIITAINQPVTIDESNKVHVTASIGVSTFPLDSENADSLIRFADEAMYKSKRLGRNCVTLYEISTSLKSASN